jgi:hypothetical protein
MVGLALLCAASSGRAQGAAGQAPAVPPKQAATESDPFTFASEAAVMLWIVKADQTEAFESVWGVIRTRLAASTKPELKALGDNLTLLKADAPASALEATYFLVANPASKTTSYGVSPFLLYESGLFERPEAEELYKLFQATIVRINLFPVNAVK